MVRQFQYIADCHDRFCRNLLYRELNAVLVIYPDGGNTRLVSFQHFVMQRADGIEFFYAPSLLQRLNTQLVPCNDVGLEVFIFDIPL